MIPEAITCAAGNNFNRATETVKGTQHNVVNMVLYQVATRHLHGTMGDIPESQGNRSIILKEQWLGSRNYAKWIWIGFGSAQGNTRR